MSTASDVVVPRIILDRAEQHADRVLASFDGGVARTFGEVADSMVRIAGGLRSLGVQRGDTVLVMLENRPEFVESWLAINALGAIEVPLNVNDRGTFLAHVIADSRARVIIIEHALCERLAELKTLGQIDTIVTVGEPTGSPTHPTIAFDSLRLAAPVSVESSLDDRDLTAVLYTSGTTGPAKGIMMSYRHAATSAHTLIRAVDLDASDVYFICMPLFHSNALIIQLLPSMMVGATTAITSRFSASTWIDDVRRTGATLTNTLGVMTQMIFAQPPRDDDADNPLRVVQTIPLPPAIGHEFENRFGVTCVDAYGLTDAGMVSFRSLREPLVPGSAGRPIETFEVRIADPATDQPVAVATVGEIQLRPRIPYGFMSGYWHNPTATVDAWRNLWFHTGDAGYLDDGGLLYFVDRLKDVIRVRGENVSSVMVEAVVAEHPGVESCAAVAVPGDLGDDDVMICVIPSAGETIDPVALLDYCTPLMPYYAVPRFVATLDEFPMTATGKVQKAQLRAQVPLDAAWDRRRAGYSLRREGSAS